MINQRKTPETYKARDARSGHSGTSAALSGGEPTVLVHVFQSDADDESALEELRLLAQSAGAEICGEVIGHRRTPDPATYLGKGKADEVAEQVKECGAQLVLINHAISPIQERNLSKRVDCRVLDRTGLILDIFAQRASTHEGKLQVELAQLRHLATRLVRGWTHLERQKGGIGLRGPGETQLETDRRLIGYRIKNLNKRLAKVRQQRTQRRRMRDKVPVPTVSLVGYTNAGKSSLFNRLTEAKVLEADQLFATLDPTMRRLEVPDFGRVILADTVGFIRQLPHNLVEAFRSTLEEVSSAALLLHVVDATDPERQAHSEQVNVVLDEIDATDVPRITVFNKIDQLGRPASFERDQHGRMHRVWLSARSGVGTDLLLQAISEHFRRSRVRRQVRLRAAAGELRAALYRRAAVLQESHHENGDVSLEIEIEQANLAWLERQDCELLDPAAASSLASLARSQSSQ